MDPVNTILHDLLEKWLFRHSKPLLPNCLIPLRLWVSVILCLVTTDISISSPFNILSVQMTYEKYWPILNGIVNSPSQANTKKVFHLSIYKNYCEKSCWVPVLFHFWLDTMPHLVGPAFNLLSHNRNLVYLRMESGLYFFGDKKKNCFFSNMHQGKQLLLQILQILCKKVVYVPVDKWQNKRNTIIVTVGSHGTTTF